jgi:hypothetical protein
MMTDTTQPPFATHLESTSSRNPNISQIGSKRELWYQITAQSERSTSEPGQRSPRRVKNRKFELEEAAYRGHPDSSRWTVSVQRLTLLPRADMVSMFMQQHDEEQYYQPPPDAHFEPAYT